jgi:hypothetical protein
MSTRNCGGFALYKRFNSSNSTSNSLAFRAKDRQQVAVRIKNMGGPHRPADGNRFSLERYSLALERFIRRPNIFNREHDLRRTSDVFGGSSAAGQAVSIASIAVAAGCTFLLSRELLPDAPGGRLAAWVAGLAVALCGDALRASLVTMSDALALACCTAAMLAARCSSCIRNRYSSSCMGTAFEPCTTAKRAVVVGFASLVLVTAMFTVPAAGTAFASQKTPPTKIDPIPYDPYVDGPPGPCVSAPGGVYVCTDKQGNKWDCAYLSIGRWACKQR